MAFYQVQLPTSAQSTKINQADSLLVVAQAADEALLVAQAYFALPSDGQWAAATATLLADAADLENWRCRVTVTTSGGTLGDTADVTVTGVTVADFDSIGALLVTALNATANIAAAAYSTPALTISETTDGNGDDSVTVELLPPTTWDDPTIAFPDFRTTIVHEGASGDALSCNLIDVVTPEVLYQTKTV